MTRPGPMQRQRLSPGAFPSLVARLFLLLVAVFILAAPGRSLAQTVTSTMDDGVPAGTYKQVGGTITYTIGITNSGGAAATGVTLTDPTPANTALVGGSLHASPLAIDDAYTAVGNTKLYVGVTAPAGEPAVVLPAGQALFANDTTITDSTVFVSNTSPLHGTVTVNSDGTFVYTPTVGYTGADSFTYTVRNSADATLTDTATVNITVGTLVWYVNNSGGAGTGSSTSPFNTLAGAAGASAANSVIYVYKGSGAYTGGLTLKSGQTLTSEFVALVVGSNTLRAAVPANVPTLSHTTASTVALSTGNTIDGFIVTNSAGNGISGSAIGTTAIADIAVTVTGGTALNATTSGSLTVTGTLNTLNSTNGTALNVANVNIGAGGLTFQSISAGAGANNGITLDTTGSTGGLIVTGDGTNTSVGGNSTGGTIANKSGSDLSRTSGNGIYLNNTSNVVLRRMTINGTNQNFGIRGFLVNNFTLEYSTVAGTNGTNPANNGADDAGEGSLYFGNTSTNGLTGTVAVNSSVISGGRARNFSNTTTSGTAHFTFTTDTFGLNQNFSDANQSLLVEARGTGTTVNSTVTGCTFTGAPGGLVNFTGQTNTIMNVTFGGASAGQPNALSNSHAQNIVGGGGITLATAGSMIFDVNHNTIRDSNGSAVTLQMAAPLAGNTDARSLQGTFDSNTIGVSGVVDSGSKTGNGLFLSFADNATAPKGLVTLAVTNNTIQQYHGNGGFYADNTGGGYDVNLTLTGNTIRQPGPGAFAGIAVTNGAQLSSDDINVFALISNNDASTGDPSNSSDIIVGASGTNSASHTFTLSGASASDVASLAAIQTFLKNTNNLNGASAATVVTAYTDPPVTVSAFKASAAVPPLPSSPSPLLFATGGVETTNGTLPHPEQTLTGARETRAYAKGASASLTQADLDTIVAAALARWEATSLTRAQLARLRALRFEVATLFDLHLGEADGDRIRVDKNAGGNGWFIGAAPEDDAQFGRQVSASRFYTDPAGAPAGRIDLLTAVLHEMGHALGLDDSYLERDRDALMYGYLTKGERRLPTRRDAAAAALFGGYASAMHAHSHFLSTPLTIGTLPVGKTVTVKHQVTVTSPSATQISNQGTISGSNFSSVLTDDPTVGGTSDATITLLAIPPAVVTNPSNQTTDVGLSNATFTASATSNPAATVQWFVHTSADGVGVFNPVAGATNTTLTISSAIAGQNGNVYHAVFTNTHTTPTSTATTTDATLTVNPALTIAPPALADATSGTATNQVITVSNGTKPYTTFNVSGFSAGTTGLTGANLATDATAGTVTLSGTPTAAGTASFTVNVTDTPGGTLTKNYTLTVNSVATTTTLASSVNPSIIGSSVQFTATVSGSGGPPTGNVDFKDGASTIGSGTLAGGTASFTTSALAIGSHSITAVYGGGGSFGASTSTTLTQVVAAADAYVLPATGADAGTCPITAPCATLNYALSVTGPGGQVTILGGGLFGPVVLTQPVSIVGIDPKVPFEIAADPSAAVGCVGGAPGSCGVNNGYGVEIAAAAADTVKVTNATITAGLSGAGALKLTSGGVVKLDDNVYRGNATATGPIVALYPNNPGTTLVEIFFANSDIGYNGNSPFAGAIEVKPSGNTSLKVQFNRVEVHNASYGIRTDASLLSGPSVSVTTNITQSEFFSFANAAVNGYSTAGTGKTNAVFDGLHVLNADVGIKANGPQSVVILTNSTVSGNATGVQTVNGGIVNTSTNNTIFGNGTDVNGALTTAPKL